MIMISSMASREKRRDNHRKDATIVEQAILV